MIPYQTKAGKLSGTSYKEVKKQAVFVYREIQVSSRRKPYVRSAYFNKQKVFLNLFWDHVFKKRPKERYERLQFFGAAIELIKNCRNCPSIKHNSNEELFRFLGVTINGQYFCVQIKRNTLNSKKYFISCFPIKKCSALMWSV